jgi:U4/U6.U5 tri-snRNP-associated protein 2
MFLALDLPPPPLFQDAVEKNIIPQVGIHTVLEKYDGVTAQEVLATNQLKRYKCQRLPPFVVLHFKRFTKNNFVEEKNPTIVNFPLRGLDLRDCGYDWLVTITYAYNRWQI